MRGALSRDEKEAPMPANTEKKTTEKNEGEGNRSAAGVARSTGEGDDRHARFRPPPGGAGDAAGGRKEAALARRGARRVGSARVALRRVALYRRRSRRRAVSARRSDDPQRASGSDR